MEYLTLKQAADRLGVTKKKVYRAVSNGHLEANEGTWRGQTALKVSTEDLDKWAMEWLDHSSATPVPPQEHPQDTPEAPQEYVEVTPVSEPEYPVSPQGHPASPPPEVYVAMMDRVARAERRAVELEFEMKKHRLLLAENAESVHEREAKIRETEAKFIELNEIVKDKDDERDRARSEAAQAKAEAELLRSTINEMTMENETLRAEKGRPWWKKMFSSQIAG